MKLKKLKSLGLLIFLLCYCTQLDADNIAHIQDSTFYMKGIDASFIPELRSLNIKTYDRNSKIIDMLDLLKNSGLNTIRLRIWHTPETIHSSFSEVKVFSKEIRNKGLQVYIDLHYSDTWADPGHQQKPKAWSNLNFNELKDSLFNYTKKIAAEIKPDYIQLGNEINEGILFPDGSINNFNQFKELLQEGIKAVRENSPDTKIILHYAGYQNSISFYNNLNDLDYDIIGLSYYPYWHGKNLALLEDTLNALSIKFDKQIIIAETAYPFSSLTGTADYLVNGYPATIDGQLNFIKNINIIVRSNSKGMGVCLWGGVIDAYKIPKPTSNGSYWENQAVLDYSNNALPVLEALNNTFTAVKNESIIQSSFLIKNYPNPFNNSTIIEYEIQNDGNINLTLYNILGERIKDLFYGYIGKGKFKIYLNGNNLASGIYYVVLKSNEQIVNHKIILLK